MADEAPDPISNEPDVEPRAPQQADLVALCRRLNALGALYLVCGGFAIMQAGYARVTGDIDLLIESGLENEAKVFQALEIFSDKAVRELDPGDVAKYVVCRVADEVLVDLMHTAGGIEYAEAAKAVVFREFDGVPIPFASPPLLWRMKRHTHRAKDQPDLLFLREWFESQGLTPPE